MIDREKEYYFLKEKEVGCQTRLKIDKMVCPDSGVYHVYVEFAEKHVGLYKPYYCGGICTYHTDIDIHNRKEVVDYFVSNDNESNKVYYFGGYSTLRELYRDHHWIRDVVQKSKKRKER